MVIWRIICKKRTLISVLSFILLISLTSFVYGQWTSVAPPSVSSNWWLHGVHFTSADEGWAVGIDNTNHTGVLLHYSESTWTSVPPPSVSTNWWLHGVYLTSAGEGWAVGRDSANSTAVLLHYSGGYVDLCASPFCELGLGPFQRFVSRRQVRDGLWEWTT